MLDNEIIYDDNDFNDEPYIAEEELENSEEYENLEEYVEEDKSKWLSYAQKFDYNEEFLADVESEDELFEKIKFFNNERRLEEAIQDEEILEAVRLKQEGKIASIKDYAAYVYTEPAEITEITSDEAAKEYLKTQMKAQGLKDKHIETMLNAMEVNDELQSEANERLKAEIENKQSTLEKRKQEYLQEQEKKKLAFRTEFDNKITRMKQTILDETWNPELKSYVNQEVINTMYEIHTGAQSSDILKRLGEALVDDRKAPKIIAYLHMMLGKDDVTIEPFLKQQKSTIVKEVNKNWKQQIQSKKITSGGGGNGKNADDIDWDNL